MKTFAEFFGEATGRQPQEHLARIARDGLPDIAAVPAGAATAGVILAWLWRWLHGPDPAATPRRLIYALPQRALTEQVAGQLRRWLANLGLTDEVALTVAQAARWQTHGAWRDDPHRPAIVVGTADVLVSKALNRALDMDRALFPIDFALVTNGAQWLVDDPQLSPQTTATLRRLAGFAAELGTAEPFALTCLSPSGTPPSSIRRVRRLPVPPGEHAAIAAAILERHSPDALTLVVMNTVDAAQRVYRHLRAQGAPSTLLHPRFRPLDREPVIAALSEPPPESGHPIWSGPPAIEPGPPRKSGPSAAPGRPDQADLFDPRDEPGLWRGRILVTAEVVDAGLKVDAALLVTEAAPWPSLARRAACCNWAGQRDADAEAWWVPPAHPSPGQRADIEATVTELGRLEGERLTVQDLLARDVPVSEPETAAIGRCELARLFDTAPDPSGDDVDIAPYVTDADDLDVEVGWAWWTPGDDGAPDPDIWVAAAEYRCRVPIGVVAALARHRAVWRFDRSAGGWTRAADQPPSRPRPGDVLLVSAADGGYHPDTGFDPSAPGPVPDCPELLTPGERAESAAFAAAEPRRWQSLDEHSEQVRDQAAALLAVLAPDIPPAAAGSAIVAGYLHDLGKAHEIWQDAICALADDDERAQIAAGRPWAKSGRDGPLLFAGDVAFRHELASLLLIDGPLARLLARSPDPDLTRYLVLAHHGKLRVHVRDHPDATSLAEDGTPDNPAHGSAGPANPMPANPTPPGHRPFGDAIRGLRQGATTPVPAMLGQTASTLTVDLSQFLLDDDRSWTQTVRTLLDRYGPFVLAYLETVVRVADWRASGARDLPV